MDVETKKTVVGNGILAAGIVAAAGVFSFLNTPDQTPVEPINEQVIVERTSNEARKELAADKMVVTPDTVHADVMLWLEDYEKKAKQENVVQDERVNKLTAVAEALTAQLTELKGQEDPHQTKLITTIEALATKVTVLDSKNNELFLAINSINNRMSSNEKVMTEDLTKVFDGFDGRISSFETRRTSAIPQPTRHSVDMRSLRFVNDTIEPELSTEALEANARIARIEALLAANIIDKPAESDPEGIIVDWGDKSAAESERTANDHPAPSTASEPKQKGIVRSLARQTGETIHGGTDVAVETANKATGVTGQLVKDLTDTATRALSGASDTASTAVGGTSDIAKNQSKKAWSKFW